MRSFLPQKYEFFFQARGSVGGLLMKLRTAERHPNQGCRSPVQRTAYKPGNLKCFCTEAATRSAPTGRLGAPGEGQRPEGLIQGAERAIEAEMPQAAILRLQDGGAQGGILY